jgi:hypothetical protein
MKAAAAQLRGSEPQTLAAATSQAGIRPGGGNAVFLRRAPVCALSCRLRAAPYQLVRRRRRWNDAQKLRSMLRGDPQPVADEALRHIHEA